MTAATLEASLALPAVKELLSAIDRNDAAAIGRIAAAEPQAVQAALAEKGFWKHKAVRAQTDIWRGFWTRLRHWDKDAFEKSAESAAAWMRTLEALEAAGGGLDPSLKGSIGSVFLRMESDLRTLEWMAARGVFGQHLERHNIFDCRREDSSLPPDPRGRRYLASGLLRTLAKAGGAEATPFFEAGLDLGLIGGPYGLSATEFACAGAWGYAQRLVDEGEGWPRCGASAEYLLSGKSPVEAMVASFGLEGRDASAWRRNADPGPAWGSDEDERAKGLRWAAALRRMKAMGAELDAGGTAQAFAALLGEGIPSQWRSVSPIARDIVADELVAMGAGVNDGHALAQRLSEMMCRAARYKGQDAENDIEWARSRGFDFALHAGAAQAEAAGWGVQKGDPVADRLVELGASWDKIGPKDSSPVDRSLRAGGHKAARKMIKAGAPFAYWDRGECALHVLARAVSAPGIGMLKEALATPEVAAQLEAGSTAWEKEGERPLHKACKELSLKAIRLLLDAGADPNAQDAKGWTPLRHALSKRTPKAQRDAKAAIEMLVAAGADPAAKDANGLTAAQADAGGAPLTALAELLGDRPEDLAAGEAGEKARKKIARRGARGRAIAEQSELRSLMAEASLASAPEESRGSKEDNGGKRENGGDESDGSGSKERGMASPPARRRL
jgi:hypothetical protein